MQANSSWHFLLHKKNQGLVETEIVLALALHASLRTAAFVTSSLLDHTNKCHLVYSVGSTAKVSVAIER